MSIKYIKLTFAGSFFTIFLFVILYMKYHGKDKMNQALLNSDEIREEDTDVKIDIPGVMTSDEDISTYYNFKYPAVK